MLGSNRSNSPPQIRDLPIAYLCGQESFCREVGSREALARAKTNVERAYPVVGVLEQLDATLEVFEARLPGFFHMARNLYYGKLKGLVSSARSSLRDAVRL